MKICIPTETNEGLNSKVYGHFGSAPFFTIYDSEQNTITSIENNNAHHSHGMCSPMSVLDDTQIDVVICGGMGMRVIQKLNEANIKTFMAKDVTVNEIIKKYQDNELEEISPENACTRHGCH